VKGLKEVLDGEAFKKAAANQLNAIKEIAEHISVIQNDVDAMIEARKVANKIESYPEQAKAYHDNVLSYFEKIRKHVDKLELMVDDELWPLPKFRELLFLK
jgi:glutamine synthetase